jgi:hypothetical protein
MSPCAPSVPFSPINSRHRSGANRPPAGYNQGMVPTVSSELRWLLDRACEYGVFVRLVLPETMDQVAQWNAPCPRWRARDVFAALRELERLGWIRFFIDNGDDEDEVPVVQPAFDHRALIDAYKFRMGPLFYRLTAAGGAAWEQLAKPNWGLRYVVEVRDAASIGEEGECVVVAMTEQIARQALLVTACSHNLMVVPGSERYVPCGPWNATYWKELESGIRAAATFVTLDDHTARIDSLLPRERRQRLVACERELNAWYARVDEPDWQRREYLNYGGMWN